jgi:cobalamin biosynthesis protein CobD/CbiB
MIKKNGSTFIFILLYLIIWASLKAAKPWLVAHQVDISIAVGAHGLIWALTVISYRITQKSFENPNPQVSIRAIMGGFMIKFLVIALAAFIYIFLQRKLVNLPALYLAALFYILYTTIEVRLLLKQLKNRSDAEKRSTP